MIRRAPYALPIVLTLVACSKPDDAPAPPAPAQQTATPTQNAPAQAAPVPVQPAGNPAGAAGRSTVPTVDEWNGAPEVTVRGSSALACSTKMVREWLKVTCSGKDPKRGVPTTCTIVKGNSRNEMFTFNANGVASLVMPFIEGTDVEATFAWTNESHRFVSTWPRGVPQRPPSMGEFK